MPTDFNTSHAQRAIREFNIRNGDFFDNRVANSITPVITLEPVCDIIRSASKTTSGAVAIYTAPAEKDFYLSAIELTYSKDATCDIASSGLGVTITATINGVSQAIVACAVITLTAQEGSVVQNFKNPIKIDRGSSLSISGGTFTAGTLIRGGIIIGYLSDTLS